MTIEEITNDKAIGFLRDNRAGREVVFVRPCDRWWGAFIDGELAGVTGICNGKSHLKLCGVFVALRHRRKGVATFLLQTVLAETRGKKIISFSRPEMARINERHGFMTTFTFPNGTQRQYREGEEK